ncbi:MAG TPA: hypothetical protein PLQ76_00400 [bacterium]|nr:hypothetical protein [bacterium]
MNENSTVKMKFGVVLVCVAVLFAGCSHGGNGKKEAAPSPAKSGASAPAPAGSANPPTAANPSQQPAPAISMAAMAGEVKLVDFPRKKGSLFLFVLDEDKLPDQIYVLASAVFKTEDIKEKSVKFRLEGVAPGMRRVTAVWDTSKPFCDISVPYCSLSSKDAVGQSPIVKIIPGAEETGVSFSVR